MPYLNTDEVESALTVATSAPFSAFTQLVTLPNATWEGRQCHAIKIANGGGSNRPGVYFLGGVHAREWGSPDILINFIELLEQAFQSGTALTVGGKTFSSSDIQAIVNGLDIIVFPQANPDGRNYSLNTDAMWRKNRRTAAPNSAACTGVDVNRNYDFLWDFPTYFNAASGVSDSTDPCDYQVYHGPSAFSEPESQNAKSIFDTFPNVKFFMDLHSYGEDILVAWGDDEDQSTDPTMNFQNSAFNGMRGVAGDAYKEYIPSDDATISLALAGALHDGIQVFRGKDYTVKPEFNLYPTAGASEDYAYSRHFVDSSKQNVISYTLEWGAFGDFHPPYSEMANIIEEVTCGLVAFCLWIRNSLRASAFILNRNPIGQDEVDARRKQPAGSQGGLPIKDAFRIVVDGFTAAELGLTGPGSTLALPVASPATGLSIAASSPIANSADNGDYGSEVQRFTFYYDLNFPDESAFPPSGSTDVTLSATVGGIGISALLTLITQPDPFLLHGDPAWLSIDLRLFVVRPNDTWFGVTMGADGSAAPDFIQQVARALTDGGGSAGGQSFDDANVLSPDEYKSKLYLQPADENNIPVFNFALAKVHYIGAIGAASVRTFFRLRQTQVTYAPYDFPPGAQYRRAANNPDGQPIALAGIEGGEYVTAPFFALPRIDSTTVGMDQQTDSRVDGAGKVFGNVQTIAAKPDGSEVDTFFGCWIDMNQPDLRLPMSVPPLQDGPFSVSDPNPSFRPVALKAALARNLHLCLIAEVDFDPSPIPLGNDPSNWDKLAQRNIVWSDAGSAQSVTTFAIRPTPVALAAGQTPDELMIDWNNLPAGVSAQIYLPAVGVETILKTADRLYGSHRLTRFDSHTLQCKTGGVSYIPIPASAGPSYAGLLTVDLPEGLPRGAVFNVVVRQLTNAFGQATPPPPPPPRIATPYAAGTKTVLKPGEVEWRRVLGAFQLTIPVRNKALLLLPEERDLSVLRWIAEFIPRHNRWHPVFHRYLSQIAGRVSTFGGNPGLILPSPTGDGVPRQPEPKGKDHLRFTGKIAGLLFDGFGDFEGFVLETEDKEHTFYSREKEIEELAERVWKERLRITVVTKLHELHRPLTIIIRQPPAAFSH